MAAAISNENASTILRSTCRGKVDVRDGCTFGSWRAASVSDRRDEALRRGRPPVADAPGSPHSEGSKNSAKTIPVPLTDSCIPLYLFTFRLIGTRHATG